MSAPPLLDATDLTVRFGDVTALAGLDLVAPTGEVLAILGPNGAGKTTFVRTIATLIEPTSGSLRVRGVDVVRDPLAVRRTIGLAGQHAAVEPTLTGRENLVMTARLFGHHRKAAQRAADDVIDRLSLGEVSDRRCSTYSGGQRRRLDLGASLVGAPKLLLLDEPTAALDPASRNEVWDAVQNLVAGGTDVLLTTHYLAEADELANHVVVIDHGTVIASGTVGDLKTSVGRDVVEIVVADDRQLGRVANILERVTSNVPQLDRTGRRATAPTSNGTRQLAAVVDLLDNADISVAEVGLRRPTLDEVFLTLTRDDNAAPAPVGAQHEGSAA
jgi:ABC-2 type transport system ATP-binding protein